MNFPYHRIMITEKRNLMQHTITVSVYEAHNNKSQSNEPDSLGPDTLGQVTEGKAGQEHHRIGKLQPPQTLEIAGSLLLIPTWLSRWWSRPMLRARITLFFHILHGGRPVWWWERMNIVLENVFNSFWHSGEIRTRQATLVRIIKINELVNP